ncbi:hypothetical protein JVU11DRAFT_12489 [Chiua virens]|nr:hypothetical protein JVU11DRAFT_12489 [Chiua virens]
MERMRRLRISSFSLSPPHCIHNNNRQTNPKCHSTGASNDKKKQLDCSLIWRMRQHERKVSVDERSAVAEDVLMEQVEMGGEMKDHDDEVECGVGDVEMKDGQGGIKVSNERKGGEKGKMKASADENERYRMERENARLMGMIQELEEKREEDRREKEVWKMKALELEMMAGKEKPEDGEWRKGTYEKMEMGTTREMMKEWGGATMIDGLTRGHLMCEM